MQKSQNLPRFTPTNQTVIRHSYRSVDRLGSDLHGPFDRFTPCGKLRFDLFTGWRSGSSPRLAGGGNRSMISRPMRMPSASFSASTGGRCMHLSAAEGFVIGDLTSRRVEATYRENMLRGPMHYIPQANNWAGRVSCLPRTITRSA